MTSRSSIVAREAEREEIGRWLAGDRPAVLEIEGEAGIGKTTLWEEAVRLARAEGALVLTCRPVEIESGVSYGALASLLEPALAMVADELPSPRLHALESAFRIRELSISNLDETAVALGSLSVVRAVSANSPVVVAIEDVQWLDASSRIALTYTLRNLRPGDEVAAVLSRRLQAGDGPLDLSGSSLAERRVMLSPGPLSLGAVHRMTHARFGVALSRPRLTRIHSASGGNPLYALELARAVIDGAPDDLLVVPPSLAEALRARMRPLSDDAQRLLLVVAAGGELSTDELARALGSDEIGPALDEAIQHGVLSLVDAEVRFTHPLLASTVYADAPKAERARAHVLLAGLAGTPEECARHLARAGSGHDEQVAAKLQAGAEAACRRGAHSAGADLFRHAASFTPDDHVDDRAHRLLWAAEALLRAGEPDEAAALLEEVAAGGTTTRFVALCRLGLLLDETVGGDACVPVFDRALETDDPAVASLAHRGLAQSLSYVGDMHRALDHADAAVASAEPLADPRELAYALAMQALLRKMAGHSGWRQPLERGLALEGVVELADLDGCPGAFKADVLRLGLELDAARAAYDAMLERATDRGDVRTETWCRFGLAAVEIARGRSEEAGAQAEELRDLSEQTGYLRLPALRTLAHVAMLGGDTVEAGSLLGAVVTEAEAAGELHNLRAALQLEGLLHLTVGDPESATEPLRRARQLAEEMAIGEPGMLLFMLDEVEARAASGDPAAATLILRDFESRCAGHTAVWIAPLVDRAHGLVRAAEGDLEAARVHLERAVGAEDEVPIPLEQARTRLALGLVLRRTQHRSTAHAMLASARDRFEELGAPSWAQRARDELARIGGRGPSGDDLTPTEQRIAQLVASGLTNREVASMLFVTPKTVESALTRVYRKLRVRSRTELARRLADEA